MRTLTQTFGSAITIVSLFSNCLTAVAAPTSSIPIALPQLIDTLRGHQDSVLALAFSPTENILASGDFRSVRLWNIASKQQIGTIKGHQDKIHSLIFSPDGKRLISGSEDNTIKVWEVSTGQEILSLGEGNGKHTLEKIFPIAVSPTAPQLLASGNWNGNISLWDLNAGKELWLIDGQQKRLWGLFTTGQGHEDSVNALAFSPDGTVLASASFDKTIRLWDVNSKEAYEPVLTGHKDWILCLAFQPQGTFLASGGYDKTVILWQSGNDKDRHHYTQVTSLMGHTDAVAAVAFHPKLPLLASGGFDKMIYLWDLDSGKPFHILTGHGDYVNTLAFSPDGKILASGSGDSTIKLWMFE